jgi:hypothetical protein
MSKKSGLFRHPAHYSIKKYILRKTHAKFGAFVRPVTVISLRHYTIIPIEHYGFNYTYSVQMQSSHTCLILLQHN